MSAASRACCSSDSRSASGNAASGLVGDRARRRAARRARRPALGLRVRRRPQRDAANHGARPRRRADARRVASGAARSDGRLAHVDVVAVVRKRTVAQSRLDALFAAANLYNSLNNLFSRVLPFTKENTLINSLQRMTSILYPFLFGIVVVMVQLFVYRNMLTTLITLLAFITLTFWINYFGFVRASKSV